LQACPEDKPFDIQIEASFKISYSQISVYVVIHAFYASAIPGYTNRPKRGETGATIHAELYTSQSKPGPQGCYQKRCIWCLVKHASDETSCDSPAALTKIEALSRFEHTRFEHAALHLNVVSWHYHYVIFIFDIFRPCKLARFICKVSLYKSVIYVPTVRRNICGL
jgi:hypothetical protein